METQGLCNDLLCLLFLLTKTMKSKGLIALEAHIERPEESSIFKRYPKIVKDHFALDFICDTLRMMTMSLEDPHQVEIGDGKASWKSTIMRRWSAPMRCNPWPTACPRWASSLPFWA